MTGTSSTGLKTISASLIYAYRLVLSEDLVASAGFQGSFLQNKLNWNELVFENQLDISNGSIDPKISELPPDQLTKGFSDFSSGILLGYKEKYYLGAAAHHLTQPDMAFYDNLPSYLDMKYTVHAGAYIDLEPRRGGNEIENMSFSPNVMYLQQGKFHQLNMGVYLNVYPFIAGTWFRHNFENPDAAIALIGFQQEKFSAGYSYDFSLSRLTDKSGGAHEVSFSWHFPCSKNNSDTKAIKCPRF